MGPDGTGGQMVPSGNGGGAMGDQIKGFIDRLPGALQGIPGNPEVAQRTGIVAGLLLFIGSIVRIVFSFGFSVLVTSLQMMILAITGIVLEGSQEFQQVTRLAEIRDVVVGQARCLSFHYGLAALHGVQMLYAFASGGWLLIIGGIVALFASLLDIVCWQMRRGMLTDGGHTGLIEEQDRM
eukprot:CAMPEP_0178421558 /NCGR_PEP_ID=MMETSP0689_2-20121128/26708_1 /TAXON_ID=160604 /ORGANISM="Amphidinium massartii, Strain CS-259" /LENGTH=180 /DNA_ID=CAMNT_0020043071 /DNA_START=124 /DNA_END=666 /DNA_ORIENTATION=-